jgi:hypothetical protein
VQNALLRFSFIAAVVLAPVWARAQFTTFSGDASQEEAWRTAVGGQIPLETFESFQAVNGTGTGGDVLGSLPPLRVTFDPIAPGIYNDAQWAHSGTKQWSNWAGGAGNAASHVLRPLPHHSIYALGFWNTDPQGDQSMHAFKENQQLLGTISGLLNSHNGNPAASDGFAGFISTVPVSYVTIPGQLGDGWNHFDDLQIITGPTVTGDFDCDGDVDGADFLIWQTDLGTTQIPRRSADADGNASINGADLERWKQNFGAAEMAAAIATPEPAAAMLSALIAGLIARRSRSFR